MNNPQPDGLASRNRRVMISAVVFVCVMVGVSFAAVPLYRLFCQVTGLGGTTQTAATPPTSVPANTRKITVRFDTTVDAALPWQFRPAQNTMDIFIGQTGFTHFIAQNLTHRKTAGISLYNVNPLKVGKYFVKTQCFCFNNQPLAAGQKVDMPVVFYVDPKMLTDKNMQDVQEITLSYRFYPANSENLKRAEEKLKN